MPFKIVRNDMSDTVTVVWDIAQEELIMMSSIFYGEIKEGRLNTLKKIKKSLLSRF